MRALLLVAIATLAITACGDDEETAPATAPAPSASGAGGPQGADPPGAPAPTEPSYEALGSYWSELPLDDRIASAEEFIADNPTACADVSPEDLARQAGVAYGIDYPRTIIVGDVMLETCALLRDGE